MHAFRTLGSSQNLLICMLFAVITRSSLSHHSVITRSSLSHHPVTTQSSLSPSPASHQSVFLPGVVRLSASQQSVTCQPSARHQSVTSPSSVNHSVTSPSPTAASQSSTSHQCPLRFLSAIRQSSGLPRPPSLRQQSATSPPPSPPPPTARGVARGAVSPSFFLYPHAAPRAAPADRNVQISFRDKPPEA